MQSDMFLPLACAEVWSGWHADVRAAAEGASVDAHDGARLGKGRPESSRRCSTTDHGVASMARLRGKLSLAPMSTDYLRCY